MFTGIVEELSAVKALRRSAAGARLTVSASIVLEGCGGRNVEGNEFRRAPAGTSGEP